MLFHKIEGKALKQLLVDFQHIDLHTGHTEIFCQRLPLCIFRNYLFFQKVIPDTYVQARRFLQIGLGIFALDELFMYIKL